MSYKPNFKWNDLLVLEFTKLASMGAYGIFENTRSIEDKLDKFKIHIEEKIRETKKKRVLVGSRGMNEDGSRFYYDVRGIKWNLKRIKVSNITYYIADSEKGETLNTEFLSDMYYKIDTFSRTKLTELAEKINLEEILK